MILKEVDIILRFLIYILGVFLISLSSIFILLYTNLFSFGYTFLEFLTYIFTKLECLCLFVGIILVVCSFKKEGSYEK